MNKTLKILLLAVAALIVQPSQAADPTATNYPVEDCLGSAKPYPAPEDPAVYPDSLTPVTINHVGRHGARFLSSAKTTVELIRTLSRADSAGVLTPLGKELLTTARYVADISHSRWGALDSLGMAEQRGIASRMFMGYPKLFTDGKVNAISSYSPRCVMSMYEFTHQFDRLNNRVELYTSSGHQNSPLMRPFDVNRDYIEWADTRDWEPPYEMFFSTTAPASPARRLVSDASFLSADEAQQLSWTEYKVLAGLPAMGMAVDLAKYFTKEELNALWACENLGHYLRRTATVLSSEPAQIAGELLLDIITDIDAAVEGKNRYNVQLRFGHAETLMPLLSLMRLKGCYYMTNYYDTVAMHWKDFDIVPMAANLQIVLFRTDKGDWCVRVDLNEKPLPLLPNSDKIYTPWSEAREYLVHCLPLILQP